MKLKSLILLAVLSLTPCVFAADPVPNVAKETVVTKVPTFDEIVVSFILPRLVIKLAMRLVLSVILPQKKFQL